MENSTTTRFLLWVRETLDLAETLAGSCDPLERQLGLLLRTDIDTALTAPSARRRPASRPTPARRPPPSAGAGQPAPALAKPSPSANGELPEGGSSLPFGEPVIPARGESDSTEGPYVN